MKFARTSLLLCAIASSASTLPGEPPAESPAPKQSIYESLKLPEPVRVRLSEEPTGPKQVIARGKRRALLVGVGQARYNGIVQTPLPQCVIDARTLKATLGDRGWNCEVAADGGAIEPTVANIREQVASTCRQAESDDQVLIYISTHGAVLEGGPSVLGQDGAVPLAFIKEQLAASRALVKILMLDCCRDDKAFASTSTEFRDVHVITACRPDESSQVGGSGMSVFTEALVDAMVNCQADRVKDGQIELDELMYFLDREVPARVARLDPANKQNPTRSVVDPKSLNPIFVTCGVIDRLTLQPTAFAGRPLPAARNDFLLTGLLCMSLQPGLSPAAVEKAMKARFDEELKLDESGAGVASFADKPLAGDVLVVRFADSRLSAVHILYARNCKEDYSIAASRAAISNLLGDRPLADLIEMFNGYTPKQIQEKLGCAAAALMPTDAYKDARGELRYPQVPRPGQMLVVIVKNGVFDGLDIVPLDEPSAPSQAR